MLNFIMETRKSYDDIKVKLFSVISLAFIFWQSNGYPRTHTVIMMSIIHLGNGIHHCNKPQRRHLSTSVYILTYNKFLAKCPLIVCVLTVYSTTYFS